MILADGVKRKLDGVVDSVPSDKDCEVLDGKLLISNGMKMKLKILLIVMIATFC